MAQLPSLRIEVVILALVEFCNEHLENLVFIELYIIISYYNVSHNLQDHYSGNKNDM